MQWSKANIHKNSGLDAKSIFLEFPHFAAILLITPGAPLSRHSLCTTMAQMHGSNARYHEVGPKEFKILLPLERYLGERYYRPVMLET